MRGMAWLYTWKVPKSLQMMWRKLLFSIHFQFKTTVVA